MLSLVCAAVAFAAPAALATPPACTDTFLSADSGGLWTTASDWSTGDVPGPADVACWDSGVVVNVPSGTPTVGSIQGGTLYLNGGNLTLEGAAASTVDSLTDSLGSTLTVPSGADVTVSDATIGGVVTGAGTLTVPSGTTTTLNGGGVLATSDLALGGTLDADQGSTYVVGSGAGSGTTLDGGTLDLTPTTASTGDLIDAGGTIDGSGDLAVSGPFDWSGGTIQIPLTQTGDGTFTIDGTGQPGLGAPIKTSSAISISNTQLTAWDAQDTITTSQPVSFAAGTYTSSSLSITASALDASGPVTLPFTFDLTGQAASDLVGDVTVAGLDEPAGVTLTVPAGADLDAEAATIDGTVTGPGTLSGGIEIGSGGSVSVSELDVSDESEVQGGATLSVPLVQIDDAGNLIVDQDGTYEAGATDVTGGGLSVDAGNGSTGQSGTTSVTTGSLTVAGGGVDGTGTLTDTGSLTVSSGGFGGTVFVDQTGGGPCTIGGPEGVDFSGGSISTTSPVTVAYGNISTGAYPYFTPSVSTDNTVTFAPGAYPGSANNDLIFSAAGFDLSGSTSVPNFTLIQTGGTTTVPAADTLSPGNGYELRGGTLQVAVFLSS